MSNTKDCPFCLLQISGRDRVVAENSTAFLIRDGYPISTGHSLIIPKEHTGSYFDLSAQQKKDLHDLLDEAKGQLSNELKPDAFNIGINDGAAAGQTVPHVHMHLIPRFKGDVADPRGGVRWVIPDKADYWS